jgi:hypothetical protein
MNFPYISFSPWVLWSKRTTLTGISAPGVYLLAHYQTPPLTNADPQAQEVIYVGETCDQTLRARWNNFNNAAFHGKKSTHSGGETYRELFGDNGDQLFVAAFPVAQLKEPVRSLFIRYVERKLILDYAVRWSVTPACNKE